MRIFRYAKTYKLLLEYRGDISDFDVRTFMKRAIDHFQGIKVAKTEREKKFHEKRLWVYKDFFLRNNKTIIVKSDLEVSFNFSQEAVFCIDDVKRYKYS